MFALRIIEETRKNKNVPFEQVIENFELGSSYSKLKSGATNEFDLFMEENYPETDKSTVESLICGRNGDVYFIERNTENKQFSYFIMTESGQTFERL
jgi:hypothetical protein